MKSIFKHILIGVLVPAILLAAAFLIPEPYSHPFIYVGIAPAKIMPFLENDELMRSLTQIIFGRITPNYAPIGVIFLVIFWFLLSVILSMTVDKIRGKCVKDA